MQLTKTAFALIFACSLISARPSQAVCPYKAVTMGMTILVALYAAKPLSEVWNESSRWQRFSFVTTVLGVGWGVKRWFEKEEQIGDSVTQFPVSTSP